MRLECDAAQMRSVEFSPDGRRLVATGALADGQGAIWEWTIHGRTRRSPQKLAESASTR
jgi:hypothetical protein